MSVGFLVDVDFIWSYMRTDKRFVLYGCVWGFVAFFGGWLFTYFVLPGSLFGGQFRHWEVSSWFYLNANFVEVKNMRLLGLDYLFSSGINLLELNRFSNYSFLKYIPAFFITIGSLLVNHGMGYTRKFYYTFKNGLVVTIGYLIGGLLVLLVSSARPSISLLLSIFLVIAIGAIIGISLTKRFSRHIPFFAIASLGGIILAGIVIFLGALTILAVIAPLILYPVVFGVLGGILTWIARNSPN